MLETYDTLMKIKWIFMSCRDVQFTVEELLHNQLLYGIESYNIPNYLRSCNLQIVAMRKVNLLNFELILLIVAFNGSRKYICVIFVKVCNE